MICRCVFQKINKKNQSLSRQLRVQDILGILSESPECDGRYGVVIEDYESQKCKIGVPFDRKWRQKCKIGVPFDRNGRR